VASWLLVERDGASGIQSMPGGCAGRLVTMRLYKRKLMPTTWKMCGVEESDGIDLRLAAGIDSGRGPLTIGKKRPCPVSLVQDVDKLVIDTSGDGSTFPPRVETSTTALFRLPEGQGVRPHQPDVRKEQGERDGSSNRRLRVKQAMRITSSR